MVAGNMKPRISHIPGGHSYQEMVTTSKDTVCFTTKDKVVTADDR